MKTIAFAFLALLATANARPQEVQDLDFEESTFIYDIVNELVEFVSEVIKTRGLDPYIIEEAEGEHNVYNANGRIQNFVVSGLSNIVVNSVSLSGFDLDIVITLPRINTSVDNAFGALTIGDRNIQGELSGSIAIVDLRVATRINLGLSDNLFDDFSFSCKLGGIEAEFNYFVIQGHDVTETANFFANALPNLLIRYEEQINSFFKEAIVKFLE